MVLAFLLAVVAWRPSRTVARAVGSGWRKVGVRSGLGD